MTSSSKNEGGLSILSGVSSMMMVVILGMAVAILAGFAVTSLAVLEVAFQGPFPGGVPRTSRRLRGAAHEDPCGPPMQCPSCGDHLIGVSPPEALALAEVIRRSLPMSDVQRVKEAAAFNASRARGLTETQYAAAGIVCPLLSNQKTCLAYSARPLHCRSQRLSSGNCGDCGWIEDAENEAGISQGLTAAGLQGEVYELNGALAIALSSQDVARRWAKGEKVFAG